MSQEMSKFKVPNKNSHYTNANTQSYDFFVRDKRIFQENASDNAMFVIMKVIKGIKMSEQTLFGRKSRCNSKYSLLQVFQLLLVCPCFMIRNPFNIYPKSVIRNFGLHNVQISIRSL